MRRLGIRGKYRVHPCESESKRPGLEHPMRELTKPFGVLAVLGAVMLVFFLCGVLSTSLIMGWWGYIEAAGVPEAIKQSERDKFNDKVAKLENRDKGYIVITAEVD